MPESGRRSRQRAYDVLMAWPSTVGGAVPSKEAVIAAAGGGLSQSTMYKHFGPTARTPRLLPELSMVEQVAAEAKELSFRPFLHGWRDEVRTLRLAPRLRLETLVCVVGRWAQQYPGLAGMHDEECPLPGPPGRRGVLLSRLPVSTRAAVALCELDGPGNPMPPFRVDAGLYAVDAAIDFLLRDRTRIPLNALTEVRADIARLSVADTTLTAQVRTVISALSGLMYRWKQAPENLDPTLLYLLHKSYVQLQKAAEPQPAIPRQPFGAPTTKTGTVAPDAADAAPSSVPPAELPHTRSGESTS